jgi:hypothetical protein
MIKINEHPVLIRLTLLSMNRVPGPFALIHVRSGSVRPDNWKKIFIKKNEE